MKYIQLPGTEITCSALCYGPALFGTLVNEEDSFKLLDKYAEMGGTILDTAHVYANWIKMGDSMSEKTIGKWLTSRGMHKKITIATKGGHFAFESPKVSRVTRQEVYQDIQESLEYLQTDCIDIYWLHRDNPELPAGEITEFMDEFHRQGLIRYFGGSNWTPSRLNEAITHANAHKLQPFTSVQNLWSLAALTNQPKDTSLVACTDDDLDFYRKSGIALFAYSSQAHGFFGIMAEHGEAGLKDHTKSAYLNEANLRRLDYVKQLADKYQCLPNDIALAFMTSQDFCCVPVFSSNNLKHLEENMKAGEISLDEKDVKFLANFCT